MRTTAAFTRALLAFACLFIICVRASAAINADGLGASYDSTQSNVIFRVYSSRATRIEVDVYASAMGAAEVLRFPLSFNTSTNIFSGSIPVATLHDAGITGAVDYGYRAWGPNWRFSSSWSKGSSAGFISDVDAEGNRFNPNKLLFDPYAREISHDPINATWTDGSVYASGASHRNDDSGNVAPKSILWLPTGQSIGSKPTGAQKDDIIYEVNVRGLTENDSGVPASVRGTYAGAELDSGAELLGLDDAELLRARSPLFIEQNRGWPDQRVPVLQNRRYDGRSAGGWIRGQHFMSFSVCNGERYRGTAIALHGTARAKNCQPGSEPGRRVCHSCCIVTSTAASTCGGHGVSTLLSQGVTQCLEVEGETAVHQKHQR
jgi:hypothetical protein